MNQTNGEHIDSDPLEERQKRRNELGRRAGRSTRILSKLEQGRGYEATVELLVRRVENLEHQVSSLTQLLTGGKARHKDTGGSKH